MGKKVLSTGRVFTMRKKYGYNKERDLHVVDPASAGVDLRKAYVSGSVDGQVLSGNIEYNDVEDPGTLMTRPVDAFEAMRQSEGVRSELSAKKAAAEAAASSEQTEN